MYYDTNPLNVLQAVQLYCGDAYGSMLWDLYGERACQFYRTWPTCVKLAWNLPRATNSYFVDNLLAVPFSTLRNQIMSRYVKFFKNLVSSKNDDVRLLAELVGKDATSITGSNISKLWQENPWIATPSEVRSKIESKLSKTYG